MSAKQEGPKAVYNWLTLILYIFSEKYKILLRFLSWKSNKGHVYQASNTRPNQRTYNWYPGIAGIE